MNKILDTLDTFKNIPLSLYIHMPWCVKKCPYCDFNSHQLKDGLDEESYIESLLADLKIDLEKLSSIDSKLKPSLCSIFIGGGTPSLFSPKSYSYLISEIKKLAHCDDIEVTMEANPGTLEYRDFNEYQRAGINRISIGAQSFNDEKLMSLGRIHKASEIIKAVDKLKASQINNFNLDLMFGLPNQSIDEAISDLETAISLNPNHISWYNLTLEPNTLFYKQPPSLPDDDDIFSMMEKGHALLKDNGYIQYEVSAFAKDNQFCQHNLNYWNFGDYLGIGAGAHAKLTLPKNKLVRRTSKKRHPKAYQLCENGYIDTQKDIIGADLVAEFMLNAFRLNQGFDLKTFEQMTFQKREVIEEKIKILLGKGLINYNEDKVLPTKLGRRFLNNIIETFLV